MNTKTGAATRWVVILTGVGSLMAALDTLVVSTALSRIRLSLDASVGQLEWTVNAYNLSFAVLLITAAALGDRFGRRRLYAVGLALFGASSAVCAVAPDVSVLIAARSLQGAGSALITPLALALLSSAFPPERRGAAIGMFSAVTGLAVASGPLVGGAVVQGIDWQWIFWINVPIASLAIPLVLTRISESHGPNTELDLRGLALVTAGALGLVWALVRGNQVGWASAETIATAASGAALLAAFIGWERHAREPMLPVEFFRSRSFSAGNTAIFFAFAALSAGVFFFAQLLQVGQGYDPLGAGLRLVPWTATFITFAPIAGTLSDRIGERPLMVTGLVVQAAGMAWLALIASAGLHYSHMLAPLIVAGIGISMAIPSAQNSVMGAVDEAAIGKAAGANSMMRQLGAVLGIAIAVAVFAGNGSYASPVAFVDGFGPAIVVAAGLSLAGAFAGMALRARPRPAAETAPAAALEAQGP